MSYPRIVDATATECWLHPAHPVEADAMRRLVDALPPPGLRGAAPIVAPDAWGADTAGAFAKRAEVWEPVDPPAWDAAVRGEIAPTAVSRILVDARGVTLGHEIADAQSDLPPGWTREARVWTRPADRASPRRLVDEVQALLSSTPDRVRLMDPHGAIPNEVATLLATLGGADRLTLWIENAHGVATAAARAALFVPNGPTVRATLLGIGPRSGGPATEFLVDDPAPLRAAAEVAALAAAGGIPETHPHWGRRRQDATEPELIAAGWTPRLAPASLAPWLDDQLARWGVALGERDRAHVLEALRGRLRPGERLEGPTLWAYLSTLIDLPALAVGDEEA